MQCELRLNSRLEFIVNRSKKIFCSTSSRQEGLITGSPSESNTIIVDEIVTVVLSNKIFQRKQSSQFGILEMQSNKWNVLMSIQSVSGERFIAGFQIMQESAARFFRER